MTLILAPAEEADVLKLAAIYYDSFRYDPYDRALFSDTHKEDAVNYLAEDDLYAIRNDPQTRVIKVTESGTNEIIGYARWEVPFKFESEEAREKAKRPNALPPFPASANGALGTHFQTQLSERKKKYMDTEKDYTLVIIVVSPAYQGKGAGSILLKYGIEKADRDGARIYLTAAAAGYEIYEKKGWKSLDDTIVVDAEQWGLPNGGISKTVCMMRDAVKASGHDS
ncbi:hypothetical protein BP6252_02522 [Coleophoma cylindrospora]|uniref:N-acetyltransferase domain-containing protein n=1 Tax=Coleophoma cylindrospora TaxID=1849047 RepID=A0A3D8SF35_9HELO|nr:hypothetical protein BP6252_02522 [Coleophoma cylindrospora]